jgi:REP element-mobilizing transposase RayT
MPRPLVIAHHLIFTVYGRWLPNDPRGSSSHVIRNAILEDLGGLHVGRREIQPDGRTIREFYREADKLLEHPVIELNPDDRDVIANSFAKVIASEKFTCWACAIMNDHVHLVMRKHKYQGEEMIAILQDCSAARLREAGKRPEDHPVWGGSGWVVFLDHPDAVRRTIAYVERNPIQRRRPTQDWPFVTPYDNWPLHKGHSPNSPYAKRLRGLGRYP